MDWWVTTAVSETAELDAPDWPGCPPGLDATTDCWPESVPFPEPTLSPDGGGAAPEPGSDVATLEAWVTPGGAELAGAPGETELTEGPGALVFAPLPGIPVDAWATVDWEIPLDAAADCEAAAPDMAIPGPWLEAPEGGGA